MKTFHILLTRDRSAFSTKWVCNFATNLSQAGHRVTLLCDSYKQKIAAPIAPEVQKINLSPRGKNPLKNLWNAAHHWFTLPTYRFNKAVKQINPDIIICYFLQDLLNVTLFQNHRIPIILMMHNPPREVFEKHFKHWWKRRLYHHLMKRVSMVQVLMPEFANEFKAEFPDMPVTVIPNQVPLPTEQKDDAQENHTIIHVAQIAFGKRQQDLIEAFLPLAGEFPQWKIKFFGKVKNAKRHRRYMEKLQQIIKEHHLENRILFPGFSLSITDEYLHSDIVALPSHSEGFGYGLADGLALGLPGLGYAFADGINEILVNGKSGYLVKDIPEFTEKLRRLMADKELRRQMGKFARNDMAKYAPQKIIGAWCELIEQTIREYKKG